MAKGEWKVSKTYAAGETYYQVYRLIDKDGVDHSGNREYHQGGRDFSDPLHAQKIADTLNRVEKIGTEGEMA